MENEPLNEEELRSLEAAASEASQNMGWLGPLCEDPHFHKFLEFLAAGVAANTSLATNVLLSPAEREMYVQRLHILRAIHDYPHRTLQACIETIRRAAAARSEAQGIRIRANHEARNGIPGSSPFEKGSDATT